MLTMSVSPRVLWVSGRRRIPELGRERAVSFARVPRARLKVLLLLRLLLVLLGRRLRVRRRRGPGGRGNNPACPCSVLASPLPIIS